MCCRQGPVNTVKPPPVCQHTSSQTQVCPDALTHNRCNEVVPPNCALGSWKAESRRPHQSASPCSPDVDCARTVIRLCPAYLFKRSPAWSLSPAMASVSTVSPAAASAPPGYHSIQMWVMQAATLEAGFSMFGQIFARYCAFDATSSHMTVPSSTPNRLCAQHGW
jgi:hypothetical protein